MLIASGFKRPKPHVVLLLLLLLILALAWHRFVSDFNAPTAGGPVAGQAVHGDLPGQKNSKPGRCLAEIESLRRPFVDLTEVVSYSRRCVQPKWTSKTDRHAITKLAGPLITHKTVINLTSCASTDLGPCDPLPLEVPYPYPKQKHPQILFGVSTTYERLQGALPEFAHWLSGSGATLVALIVNGEPENRPGKDLAGLEKVFADSGITLKALTPQNKTLTAAQNHFAILADLMDEVSMETKWLGLVDDDTFFPSWHNLNAELSRHDHSKPMWLGALSEDFDSIKTWGFMAYGGAGVFLTVPLARQLVPHIQACLSEATLHTGDTILRDCIHDHTTTKLTIVPGLYQHDLYGDLSGFYESGVRPLSVHHWKTWYKEPIPKMAAITSLCGDCFLQRWQFGSDTLLANGYSVSQYKRGLASYDLTQMEGTWSQSGREFDFSLGPLRPALGEEEKTSYRLKEFIVERNGNMRQIYIHKGDFFKDEMDSVFELVWDGSKVGHP